MAILFATSSTITFMISERSRSCSCFDICAEVKIEILWKWWVKISSEASYLCANTVFLAASDKNFTAEWKNSVNEILENLSSTASLQWVPNLAGQWSNWKILFESVYSVDEWLIWKLICLSDRTGEKVESVIKFKSKQLSIRYKYSNSQNLRQCMLSVTPFNNSLMFPRTPFKGSFKGPSRARLKEWSNGHYLPALYSSAGAHEMVFWNVLNLMIWMRAIGVEMKMLRGGGCWWCWWGGLPWVGWCTGDWSLTSWNAGCSLWLGKLSSGCCLIWWTRSGVVWIS